MTHKTCNSNHTWLRHDNILILGSKHWSRHVFRKTQRRHAHSRLYWFTKFCYSACLSHFAAPFIIIPAKTSNAENFVGIEVTHWKKESMKEATMSKHTEADYLAATDILESSMRQQQNNTSTQKFTTPNHCAPIKSCKWSFRRFTYGNLVTTSPSSKW